MRSSFPKKISINQIADKVSELYKFANITEDDVANIWINGEIKNLDSAYAFDAPLYVKMLFRFRGTKISPHLDYSPAFLFNGVDPGNRNRLLVYFDLYDCHDVIHFFVWISSSFGKYEINQIAEKTNSNVLYDDFLKNNEIKFFLSLSLLVQQHIIDKYNNYIENFESSM
jgi:hypothetical protein